MKSKNCLTNHTLTVEITGISLKGRAEAVSKAFSNLQAEVSKEIQDLIVYMKPIEVSVEEMEIQEYTERFLLIFMPRKKEKVRVTLSVTVEVASLTI